MLGEETGMCREESTLFKAGCTKIDFNGRIEMMMMMMMMC